MKEMDFNEQFRGKICERCKERACRIVEGKFYCAAHFPVCGKLNLKEKEDNGRTS